jgi:hypothetical protein
VRYQHVRQSAGCRGWTPCCLRAGSAETGTKRHHVTAAVTKPPPTKRKVCSNDLANASANNDPERAWMRMESAAGKNRRRRGQAARLPVRGAEGMAGRAAPSASGPSEFAICDKSPRPCQPGEHRTGAASRSGVWLSRGGSLTGLAVAAGIGIRSFEH